MNISADNSGKNENRLEIDENQHILLAAEVQKRGSQLMEPVICESNTTLFANISLRSRASIPHIDYLIWASKAGPSVGGHFRC